MFAFNRFSSRAAFSPLQSAITSPLHRTSMMVNSNTIKSTAGGLRLARLGASRQLSTTAPAKPSAFGGMRLAGLGAAGLVMGGLQYDLGKGHNFFEHKFIATHGKPEDLADFYGTEDFMELFCVFPFMVHLMMRTAEFDDDGTIHAWGLLGPGEMAINIDFDETEIDTTGDGEADTVSWFNKKEKFLHKFPAFLGGSTYFTMTQNFGYHLKDDGTCEIYHNGEDFQGFFPIRLLFQMHARYVIWATEKYVNDPAFGVEDRDDDREEQRQNIPLHVFKDFIDELTEELEKAKDFDGFDLQKKEEMEVTLQRLKTISAVHAEDGNKEAASPHLLTLRSHKTNMATSHLVIDDKGIKETIRTAMKQIGSVGGNKHAQATGLGNLHRRTTIANQKK